MIEHTNNVLPQELEDDGMSGVQLVSVVSVPTVGSTQTIGTSNADSDTPPLSPQTAGCEIIVPSSGASDIEHKEVVSVAELLVESRPSSPGLHCVQVFASTLDEQDAQATVTVTGSFSPGPGSGVTYTASLPVVTAAAVVGSAAGQFITASPSRPFSPDQDSNSMQRLPSVLEAAMKAEPKVEVERCVFPLNGVTFCKQLGDTQNIKMENDAGLIEYYKTMLYMDNILDFNRNTRNFMHISYSLSLDVE